MNLYLNENIGIFCNKTKNLCIKHHTNIYMMIIDDGVVHVVGYVYAYFVVVRLQGVHSYSTRLMNIATVSSV